MDDEIYYMIDIQNDCLIKVVPTATGFMNLGKSLQSTDINDFNDFFNEVSESLGREKAQKLLKIVWNELGK